MKVLITGGCGYKGHVLVPKLLELNIKVVVIDTQWFGNFLEENSNLTVIKDDIRNITKVLFNDIDVVIHLAAIANDPCSELDPKLSWEVGSLSTMRIADFASKSNVKQFIYASSGSVYGIKNEEDVTEDLELEPISEYNKNKMVSERVLLSYSDKFSLQIVRPATVCGLSPRMRLDVAVNLLTMQALSKKEIIVLGGEQTRPNIHIDDITDLYIFLLKNKKITGIFNAGFENISILDMAKKISNNTKSNIIFKKSNDPRSYRINSKKIELFGFKPKKNISIAINEICEAYEKKLLFDEDRFYNLKWMKHLGIF